ncbi:MAG: ribonuclease E inhibitor RraB [Nocardioides sp.]
MPVERPRPPRAPFDTGHPGDDAQLEAMAVEAHLVVPRRWAHFLYFTEEIDARAAAEILEAHWHVDLQASPGGTGWTVHTALEGARLSALKVKETRNELTALAAQHHGEYDGWRAWL